MFEAIPKADAVLLKWILHDWNDEECIKILKRCKEAISSNDKGGKLIIIDMVVMNDEPGNKTLETQLRFDMMMMTLATGRERARRIGQSYFKCLLCDYKITLLQGFRSVIEVYP
ncbi:putative trans-resveratrol di-O-methyltransferase [Helianthus annuus]|nr:putative trans-resveratrol di-O-methyltransferase [Helianthus annuus]